MMKKVLFCSYREWAAKIVNSIESDNIEGIEITKVSTKNDLIKNIEREFDFISLGWSEIIEKNIVDNNFCICLTPFFTTNVQRWEPITKSNYKWRNRKWYFHLKWMRILIKGQ